MRLLNQTSTTSLLKKYKFPLIQSSVCANLKEALEFSKNKYPVVLKIDSPDIIHKSDIGAVKIGIGSEVELKKAYKEIIDNVSKFKKNAVINGMLIQKQFSGHNIIIGMKRDPTFGPVLIFGLGGVLVELLKDISRRIAPINKKDALEMISEIKSFELLKGYRGNPGGNIDILADILVKLSDLSMKEKDIAELDFNPVLVDEKKAYIVDARILNDI